MSLGTRGCFYCRVSPLLGAVSWDVRLSWVCSSSLCLHTALGVLALKEMAAPCGGNTTTVRKKIISQHFVLVEALGWQQCGCVWVLELPQGPTAIHGSTSWVNSASKIFPKNSILGKIRFEKANNVSGGVISDKLGCWSQVSRCCGHPHGLLFMSRFAFRLNDCMVLFLFLFFSF